ncbi:hypothetical protein HIM_04751 [Hirsutella minnesotensis 3608]|uniref:O-methyltransferase C-terminal domain-containing protein n=1 Tax=Hirsutella minnesotensis 3608 TaxID=1043627 RepID=A0A0F8A163_9HYPO|nr:hypothetical protein HIM_04751 [Hirsutella minnesotensis 3608]
MIVSETQRLDEYLRDNAFPEPSLNIDAPDDFPRLPLHLQNSRLDLLKAIRELEVIVRGPKETLRWSAWNCIDTLSLQIVNSYGIAKLVPMDSPISLAELKAKTSLDSVILGRVLRHAMTNRIFHEPSPGVIAHTLASRILAQDDNLQDWIGFKTEDVFPAAAMVLQSLREYPEATSPTTTGFNFAFDTVNKETMFETFLKDPARAKRMGGAMASLTGGEGYEITYFADNYDLSAIDNIQGTLVDVGGSHGFVCIELAKKWKKMKFVVQDLSSTIESAPQPICEDEAMAARIRLQSHDFFQEQPIKDADVYFFRWIIHNYSTPYAVAILRNLVPALKPGARIVINDNCLRSQSEENFWDEKVIRSMDITMLALLNAQEREEHEFRALFLEADSRFAFQGVTRIPNCKMSIIEAIWTP